MRTHSLINNLCNPTHQGPPSHTCHLLRPTRVTSVPPSPPKLSYNYRPKSQARSSRSKLSDCDVSEMEEARKLRSEFLQVLRSRRSGEVAMLVEPAKPVANPLFQEANPPSFSEAMNACPKARIPDFKDKLQEENFYLITEALISAWKQEARMDLGKSVIDKEVVEKVWDRIVPGLASQFDSPCSIPAIAPRPLLILNGAEDPLCPLAGLEVPKSKACKAYADAHAVDNFKLIAQPGIRHRMTPLMVTEASDWFDQFLKQ